MIRIIPIVLLIIGATETVGAEPFYSRNLNPFAQVYGLPAIEGGEINSTDKLSAKVLISMANSFTSRHIANESIILDGETYYFTTVFRYGLSDSLELGVDIPYINHSGGIFDHFIEGWHDFFGLPDANRDERKRYLTEFKYTRNGVVQHEVSSSDDGIGDIRLAVSYKLFDKGMTQTKRALALRAGLKLPTGSAENLQGSESTDISIALAGNDNKTFTSQNVSITGMLGVAYFGSGKVLNNIKKDFAGFASIGAGWRFWEKYELALQLDSHTPVYDSQLDELGVTALQLNFGGSVQVSKNMQFELCIFEDINTDTTPDIVIQAGLTNIF